MNIMSPVLNEAAKQVDVHYEDIGREVLVPADLLTRSFTLPNIPIAFEVIEETMSG